MNKNVNYLEPLRDESQFQSGATPKLTLAWGHVTDFEPIPDYVGHTTHP